MSADFLSGLTSTESLVLGGVLLWVAKSIGESAWKWAVERWNQGSKLEKEKRDEAEKAFAAMRAELEKLKQDRRDDRRDIDEAKTLAIGATGETKHFDTRISETASALREEFEDGLKRLEGVFRSEFTRSTADSYANTERLIREVMAEKKTRPRRD